MPVKIISKIKKAIAVGDRFFILEMIFTGMAIAINFSLPAIFLPIQSQTKYRLLGLVFNYAQLLMGCVYIG